MQIFILFGQTATGKTAKALELVEKYNGEIVNFDSRQIYKKLDIITGKDIPKESKFKLPPSLKLRRVNQNQIQNRSIGYYEFSNPYSLSTSHSFRLWLYDIVDPKTPFSSADYVECAEVVLKDIISRGKTPILVGGTGFYLRHLIYGAPEIGVSENWELRKSLNGKTIPELQSILGNQNKHLLDELNNSDRNNPHRLIRRIEIAQSGLATLPVQNTQETLTSRLTHLGGVQEAVTIRYLPYFHNSRIVTQNIISERVEERMKAGAIEEVQKLLAEGYAAEDPGLNAMGYKQLIAYLENKLSLSEAKKQWATKEVQYAKRQRTYFQKYFPNTTKT